jgi:amino acid transporter
MQHPPAGPESPHLIRGLTLGAATATNLLMMIGAGPFITIPLMLATMSGPQAILGWLLAAVVVVCDGFVWAELGTAMPDSAGPYRYLSEAYGPRGLGRLMSFLFIWMAAILGPLYTGGLAVAFAQYTRFLWKGMTPLEEKAVAVAACGAITLLLYRDIRSVGRLSVAMCAVVLATVAAIIAAGFMHLDLPLAFDFPEGAFNLSPDFFIGLGGASLLAMYNFSGYGAVCLVAGEVREPERVIPRSILLSIGIVGAMYLTMQVAILSVVPWREAMESGTVVSDFMQRLYGPGVAGLVTVIILLSAFGCAFSLLLAYSRVPYLAATEGRFFRPFARLHPRGNFPSFSLLFMGGAAACASLLDLEDLIKVPFITQALVLFIGQVIAIPLIRRRPGIARPFRMPLYPWTAIVALLGWVYVVFTSGWAYVGLAFALIGLGIGAYLILARVKREWPFSGEPAEPRAPGDPGAGPFI